GVAARAEPPPAPPPPNCVAFPEAFVEEFDVVPNACVDSSARVDELEREIRVTTPCAQALLAGDGEEHVDDSILCELGDHGPILGPRTDGNLARCAAFEAVSGASLRPWNGGAAGCGRLASARRRHARQGRSSRHAEPR